MKICDLTQFYSPVGGGVKRYVSEKVRHVIERTPDDEHIFIVPGERDEVTGGGRSRIYTIKSPLISRTSRYRALVRLEAVETVLVKERPDIIESGDPYQLAWKAVHSGAALGIPVVGFYHSHFPEAYLRSTQKFLGATVAEFVVDLSRRYVRALYNRFERTIVPSPALGALLGEWGVRNVAVSDLGADTAVFRPGRRPDENVRARFGIPESATLLLYVGRLALEKNTKTLFATFRALAHSHPGRFHLFVVGDGTQRPELAELCAELNAVRPQVTWVRSSTSAEELAQFYRAADLFVHPGVQETFGLVAIEAQACGTPVIGIRGSYMDRVIQSDQTLWAEANTPAALAAAIVAHSGENVPANREHLHHSVAVRYSWAQVFDRLFDLYRAVIHEYCRR